MRNTLQLVLNSVRDLPAEELPGLIGELEAVKATAWERLTAPTPTHPERDELLSVAEAARRLGVSEDYLYRHSGEYAFTRRQGRKLLFSALGIDKYIRQQQRNNT
jgi:excisionase family DNA binding protein